MQRLSDRVLKAMKPKPGRKDYLVFDTACPGLGVRATSSGSRLFIAQWTDPATKRKVREPLGVWGALTVEKAREAAKARLGQVAKGINPRIERLRVRQDAERERAEAVLTFEMLIDEWATLHLAGRSKRYCTEAQRAIKRSFAKQLKRPAARITRADAVNALDKLVKADNATMAVPSLMPGLPFLGPSGGGKLSGNPFQGLPIATATVSRERVLSDAELADVWSATEAMDYPWKQFYRLALLTMQRRETVAGAQWCEISEDVKTWCIPGSKMKGGKRHDVHLSEAARAVLRTVPRIDGCDLVFSTTSRTPISGFSKAKSGP